MADTLNTLFETVYTTFRTKCTNKTQSVLSFIDSPLYFLRYYIYKGLATGDCGGARRGLGANKLSLNSST